MGLRIATAAAGVTMIFWWQVLPEWSLFLKIPAILWLSVLTMGIPAVVLSIPFLIFAYIKGVVTRRAQRIAPRY